MREGFDWITKPSLPVGLLPQPVDLIEPHENTEPDLNTTAHRASQKGEDDEDPQAFSLCDSLAGSFM